jgi:16S rRNA (guanine966-N2)-methyltransferase
LFADKLGAKGVAKTKKGVLRINGGFLKGRCLQVGDVAIRPTKAQVRKTLFNWLRPIIAGKRCLDCFTGSGILGVEAKSEGAGAVVCLDRSEQVVRVLSRNIERMNVEEVAVSLWSFPERPPVTGGFDIVFLDPPFDSIRTEDVLCWLQDFVCLNVHCLVYVEAPAANTLALPDGFELYKQARSAGVQFCLLRTTAE